QGGEDGRDDHVGPAGDVGARSDEQLQDFDNADVMPMTAQQGHGVGGSRPVFDVEELVRRSVGEQEADFVEIEWEYVGHPRPTPDVSERRTIPKGGPSPPAD